MRRPQGQQQALKDDGNTVKSMYVSAEHTEEMFSSYILSKCVAEKLRSSEHLCPQRARRPLLLGAPGGSDRAVPISLEVRVVPPSPALLLGTEDVAAVLLHVSLTSPAVFVCLLSPSQAEV